VTKYQAHLKAAELWSQSDRYGCTTLRQKKHSPRFIVGHQKRSTNGRDIKPMIVMGASDVSWEDAFARAAKCPCEGDYCTDPDCDMPEVTL
jgi:hypothetical protein